MGFDVTVQFTESVALIDVRGASQYMEPVFKGAGLGLPPTPHSMLRSDSATVYRVGRNWCLVKTAMDQESDLLADLNELSRTLQVQCTCVTDSYRGIELKGPDADDVLSQVTSLNLYELADDCATFTEIFGLKGFIVRHGPNMYTIFCDRSYADYTMKRTLKCAFPDR